MDRVRNDEIRDRLGVAPIEEKLVQHRLRWFGHVQRRPPEAPVHSGIIRRNNDVKRGRDMPNLTGEEAVKRDLRDWNIVREKKKHILLKLDIAKAFDSISWSFLLEVMQHLGFPRRWCDFIISHLHGLRQGDLLPPMLFILDFYMGVLDSLIEMACEDNLQQPQQSSHRISFYTDDVVLFLRPESGDLQVVTCQRVAGQVWTRFCAQVKSSAIPIQCLEDVDHTSEILSCGIGTFLCTYLGIPLTIHKPTTRRGLLWKGQEQAKCGNCLVSWAKVLEYLLIWDLVEIDLQDDTLDQHFLLLDLGSSQISPSVSLGSSGNIEMLVFLKELGLIFRLSFGRWWKRATCGAWLGRWGQGPPGDPPKILYPGTLSVA
ncbi:hypothetical protein U9M48_007225 [Paspalum notatum var. saurae]|uniref:Reverse transcriptase domain-containing protein n=1 Tax=Paspalum notatum var. saurae TaxID=547442 RepID=A0AAQ3Q052_PASNO